MKAVEKYYTISETSLLMSVAPSTVRALMKAGNLGPDVVNLGDPDKPNYRIPASGINGWIGHHRLFPLPDGLAARSEGQLRRIVALAK